MRCLGAWDTEYGGGWGIIQGGSDFDQDASHQYRGALPRALASDAAAGGGSRSETGETRNRKPSSSTPPPKSTEAKDKRSSSSSTGKKPGSSDAKSDDDDEYPDHCGDLATFVEGRQVVEWVSPQSYKPREEL